MPHDLMHLGVFAQTLSGARVIHVCEPLVREPESVVRQLIEFCDLPWHPRRDALSRFEASRRDCVVRPGAAPLLHDIRGAHIPRRRASEPLETVLSRRRATYSNTRPASRGEPCSQLRRAVQPAAKSRAVSREEP
jgi:hypothetical protein